MAYYKHDPSLLTHADGFSLANGATTDDGSGWTLTCALSTGGTITHRTSPVRSWESVGNAGVARLDGPITAAAVLGVEVLLNITALPTGAANRLIEIRHATGYAMKVEQNTDGTVIILNAANATVYTSTALTTGLVRLFAAAGKGTGTTDGDLILNIYTTNPETSTTPDQSYSTAVGNAGTADLIVARFPRVSSTAGSTATVRLINAQAQDSLTPIGPLTTSVTASPTGIASGLAFGAVAVALALAVAPTGIASAEAFGTPVVTIPITASPVGIGSGEAFGSPSISTSLTAAPTGIVSSQAFGTVTVSMSGNVSPVGIPSGEAFGTPAVTATLVASPTGIGSAEAFGTPAVATTLTATPTSIPSAGAFGVPAVSLTLTVGPTGIVSAEAFGTLEAIDGSIPPLPDVLTLTSSGPALTLTATGPALTLTATDPALTLTGTSPALTLTGTGPALTLRGPA